MILYYLDFKKIESLIIVMSISLLVLFFSCNKKNVQDNSSIENNSKFVSVKDTSKIIKSKANKRGCSGYYFFIQDRLRALRLANTPYKGSSASKDFAEEWEALSEEEKEKYNSQATSK